MKKLHPFFSIIIPTYNRPKQLAVCLQSLANLEYPRDCFEVIVVDDGSPIALEPVIAPFRCQLPITLLNQKNAGPATARNTGAARARGEFIVFTDDDCAPAPDYLQRLAERLAKTTACALGGRTINALSDNPYSTASQLLIDYLYAYYNVDPGQACFLTSNNMALPTELFHAIGGFDTSFALAAGEDRELCDRWRHHGHRIIYATEALVYHSHAMTLRKFWRQHFNYGRGAAAFHQTRGRRNTGDVKLEPVSFYLNLLRYPFSQNNGIRSLTLATLLLLSQAANAAGFFLSKARN